MGQNLCLLHGKSNFALSLLNNNKKRQRRKGNTAVGDFHFSHTENCTCLDNLEIRYAAFDYWIETYI